MRTLFPPQKKVTQQLVEALAWRHKQIILEKDRSAKFSVLIAELSAPPKHPLLAGCSQPERGVTARWEGPPGSASPTPAPAGPHPGGF